MLWSIIVWALIGLIAGWLAGQVTRGGSFGVGGNIVVGLIGALLGGFLAQALFNIDPVTGFNLPIILTAFIGAVLFVWLLNVVTTRRRV
ncbi:MAG: GlsB/YeaQ/YmgE family stress response membrane protein [Chloroflexota bacterium]|nr:GlsB/YeaQ/YmgE family stress response membrane protein [Chloroflexota bacterium]